MGDFIWRPEFSVGDDHLDEQHRGLIELIDMLEEIRLELATYENTTLAKKDHVNKLMTDLQDD